MADEQAVTVSGIAKYVPLLAAAAVSLVISAFGWGVTYSTLVGRVSENERQIANIKIDVLPVADIGRRLTATELGWNETRSDLKRMTVGIDNLDRRSYAAACVASPKNCSSYIPALPNP